MLATMYFFKHLKLQPNKRKTHKNLKGKIKLKIKYFHSILKLKLLVEPHLQVRQLSECLAADVALVLDFAVLFLQWVRQHPVSR